MEAMFNNSSKHCFIGPDGKKNIEKIIDMAAFIAGGRDKLKKRPIVSFNLCPTSPLQLNPTATDALILAREPVSHATLFLWLCPERLLP